MSELFPCSVFLFRSQSIRAAVLDGRLWFSASDVCKALDITWSGATLRTIPQSWQKLMKLARQPGARVLKCICEPAVYKLAFRSKKPQADSFTNWVSSEVLPAIRHDGTFQGCDIAGNDKALARPRNDEILRGKVCELASHIRSLKDAACQVYTLAREQVEVFNLHPVRYATPEHALVCKACDTMNTLHWSLDHAADAILQNAQIIDLAVALYSAASTWEQGPPQS
ncbi:hypothetical protein LJC59_09000 [Desulfovibrio sp. OttesenSCG-928-A18]|nr:hypothetical protein [Desulfovibrio sp. OttesenSCG-928-A18]